jgi:hypothetical protein
MRNLWTLADTGFLPLQLTQTKSRHGCDEAVSWVVMILLHALPGNRTIDLHRTAPVATLLVHSFS